MHRLGVEEVVIGDLLEKRAAGGSAVWLWWQVLGAIATTNASTIWRHKLLSLRAIAVGGAALWVMRMATVDTVQSWSGVFGVTVGNYLLETRHDSLRWVFLTYHLHGLPRVLWSCIGFALTGWIVGRTHREQKAAMVSLVAVVLALHYGYGVAQLLGRIMSLQPGVGYPYTLPVLILLLLIPGVLMGGLWVQTEHRSERPVGSP